MNRFVGNHAVHTISVFLILTLAHATAARSQIDAPIILDATNSTTHNVHNWSVPQHLSSSGMFIRPIKQLQVTMSSTIVPTARRDLPLNALQMDPSRNDWTIVNGPFFGAAGGHVVPLGTIIRNGQPEFIGPAATFARGALVITGGGNPRLAIVRPYTIQPHEIQHRFGGTVRDLVSGGILLLENGNRLSDREILEEQGADPGRECRAANHTLFGIRGGAAYVIFNPDPQHQISCARFRDLLHGAGFTALIKMDGSSGFYYRDSASWAGPGGSRNPVGFVIWE